MILYDLIADIALTRINNPSGKIVLLALASYCNSEGECFPSQPTLAADTCLNVRTVRSALKWLEEHGYIEVIRQSNRVNHYQITSMKGEDMPHEEKFSPEVDSNITKLDISKKSKSNLTTSAAKFSAHPNDSPHFLAFWSVYPRRIGKGAARTAFRKATELASANQIIQAAKDYADFCIEQKTEKRFIPHASTWLNQERWEDDLELEADQSNNGWGDALNGL